MIWLVPISSVLLGFLAASRMNLASVSKPLTEIVNARHLVRRLRRKRSVTRAFAALTWIASGTQMLVKEVDVDASAMTRAERAADHVVMVKSVLTRRIQAVAAWYVR